MDCGTIPAETLLVIICPIHKGGSRSLPKQYRPVALTSHIIKIFERAVDGRLSSLSPVISGVPQGTVLGPILFLLHISCIAREVSPGSTVSSYVDDTRVTRCMADPTTDCQSLQDDLEAIYRWAEDTNMVFNGDKFEVLRFWPGKTPKPINQYRDPEGNTIEEKLHLRDLGVEISSDLSFSTHIENVASAGSRMVGWILRTFSRRSKGVMITLWKTVVQSKLDYCSQLWSPSDQSSISLLEGVAKAFTARVSGMEGLDYWDRLKQLGMYSQERRRERYQLMFIWKLSQGLVTGYSLPFQNSDRRGTHVTVPPLSSGSPSSVRKAREASLQVKGARLFNIMPIHLRNMTGVSVETFKSALDTWLGSIPDQPTTNGRQRGALTNSLLDQVNKFRLDLYS